MPPLSPDATILKYLNDREERALPFVGFWRPQCPPGPPMTPQYLTILMTERRGAIIFCRILAPLNAPPPDATTLNYLNHRGGGGAILTFVGFWRPGPHPLPQTPQYLLTILMTERGGTCGAPISCKKLNI